MQFSGIFVGELCRLHAYVTQPETRVSNMSARRSGPVAGRPACRAKNHNNNRTGCIRAAQPRQAEEVVVHERPMGARPA
jgi:hypothetical protein